MTRWRERFALWCCRMLNTHPQRYRESVVDDGVPAVRCGRCGFVGLVDSQGNLF